MNPSTLFKMEKQIKYEEKIQDLNEAISSRSEKKVNVKELVSRLNRKRKKEKMISYGLLAVTIAALGIIGFFVSI